MLGRCKTRHPAETLSAQRVRRYLVAGFIAVAVFALFQHFSKPEDYESTASATDLQVSDLPGLSRWISETGSSGVESSSQLAFQRDGLSWKLQLWQFKNVCITSRHRGEAYVELVFLSGVETPPEASKIFTSMRSHTLALHIERSLIQRNMDAASDLCSCISASRS